MSFYLRKSIRVGPFRFNLSNSGVGVSAGVTGFRVGSGPRGNYIHMGRGGIYYRKTLPSGRRRGHADSAQPVPSKPQRSETQMPGVGPMIQIESGDVAQMTDSSSAELLQELDEKRKKTRWAPIAAIIGAIVVGAAVLAELDLLIVISLGVAAGIAVYLAYRRDVLTKTVVLFYSFDPSLEKAYARLHDTASKLAACVGCWHISSSGKVYDRKYHAGASDLVDRKRTFIRRAPPPFLKTNIDTVSIGVGRQTMYLFPDRVLVYETGKVGAVSYNYLSVSATQTRFIETSAPSDARVVDRTWRYVNKRGGPDRRFSNNSELPVCLYDELHFTSSTGLNEIIQISRCGLGEVFKAAVAELRVQISHSALQL